MISGLSALDGTSSTSSLTMQFSNIEVDVNGQQKVGQHWQQNGSQGDTEADKEHDKVPVLHAMELGQIADDHREGTTDAAGRRI